MPAAIVGGALTAAGSVAGGISGGKAAKKSAQIQADAAARQQAFLQGLYDQNKALFTSDISNGDAASARIMDLLRLGQGGAASQQQAFDSFRSTPGYQFKLAEALRGVNSNAFAAGLGNSGATFRALQGTAMGVADQAYNTFYDQVSRVADRGVGSKAALSGVNTTFAHDSNNVTQNAADSASAYQMYKAANFNNTLNGILRGAGQAFGTSYGKTGG